MNRLGSVVAQVVEYLQAGGSDFKLQCHKKINANSEGQKLILLT
jgi:hypothetical protein